MEGSRWPRAQEAGPRGQHADGQGPVTEFSPRMPPHILQAIQRSRGLLAISHEILGRTDAAAKYAVTQRGRRAVRAEGGTASGQRPAAEEPPSAGPAGSGDQISRAKDLRKQSRDAIAAFAEAHERLAQYCEEAAALVPDRQEQYQRLAERARQSACRAQRLLAEGGD